MLVFGTRPEAIKMAPLVKAFQNDTAHFDTVVCVTGQHREMLGQVLGIFGIRPQYDLDIMQPGQDLYDITARVLIRMRGVLDEVRPDIVLVHGDTTTSMAAALAAYYRQTAVGHVEAGLRTHNIYSPWPEEVNRQVISRIATYHFAPSQQSRENLLHDGIPDDRITVTGNTVYDALYYTIARCGDDGAEQKAGRRTVLITVHRRENAGTGFTNIFNAVKSLAAKYPDVDFVYPVHPNPHVREAIRNVFGIDGAKDCNMGNLHFREPLDYIGFVRLMSRSTLILTDSGGIQEEAPALGKPVLVVRDTTERPEAVEAGTVKLVGTDRDNIVHEVSRLLDDRCEYDRMCRVVNPYGDGKACERILRVLREHASAARTAQPTLTNEQE